MEAADWPTGAKGRLRSTRVALCDEAGVKEGTVVAEGESAVKTHSVRAAFFLGCQTVSEWERFSQTVRSRESERFKDSRPTALQQPGLSSRTRGGKERS